MEEPGNQGKQENQENSKNQKSTENTDSNMVKENDYQIYVKGNACNRKVWDESGSGTNTIQFPKNGKIIKWIDEFTLSCIGDDGNTRLLNSRGETHFLPGDTFEK